MKEILLLLYTKIFSAQMMDYQRGKRQIYKSVSCVIW